MARAELIEGINFPQILVDSISTSRRCQIDWKSQNIVTTWTDRNLVNDEKDSKVWERSETKQQMQRRLFSFAHLNFSTMGQSGHRLELFVPATKNSARKQFTARNLAWTRRKHLLKHTVLRLGSFCSVFDDNDWNSSHHDITFRRRTPLYNLILHSQTQKA